MLSYTRGYYRRENVDVRTRTFTCNPIQTTENRTDHGPATFALRFTWSCIGVHLPSLICSDAGTCLIPMVPEWYRERVLLAKW